MAVVEKLSTPRRAPRSSSAAATWTSRCVSTPPVMLRAIVVIVICSFRLGWVTPHRQDDGQDSEGPVRQAPMRSLRPTGWCRVSVRAGPTDRLEDSPRGRQPVLHGVRPGSGTHPHADQFCLCSGGPSAGYVNPRCRLGGAPRSFPRSHLHGDPVTGRSGSSTGPGTGSGFSFYPPLQSRRRWLRRLGPATSPRWVGRSGARPSSLLSTSPGCGRTSPGAE